MKKDLKIIFEFFKNSTLTEKEIENFQNYLLLVYEDFKSLQLANSIFTLQLKIFKESKNNLDELTHLNSVVEIKNFQKKINKEQTIIYLLNQLYSEKSKEVFLKILREIGIYKGKISYELTDKEYLLIEKDYLKLVSNNSNKPKLTKKPIKKKPKRNNHRSFETVYDKLRYSKSIGKFISIRTK